jgi:uncharacterized small protein (DUF1192 family)
VLQKQNRKSLLIWRQSAPKLRAGLAIAVLWWFSSITVLRAARNPAPQNPGLVNEFAASADDVLQALQEVLQDQTIHGTQIYDREPKLTGAIVVQSTPLFPPWKGQDKVFYKIRTDAIAPRHFQESADQGTIAVRYVVTTVSPERTRLRIDAIFVETSHRAVHPSDGTVESSEYKAIQEHLQAIQFAAQEAAETQRRRESLDLAKQTFLRERQDQATLLATAQSSVQDLEQRVNSLRHEIERRVKAPGANLKAAPFNSAANLANLAAYTDVVIVIVTPHWYGVETPSGMRGWLPLDQLEPLP